jgi:hypothetical protein
LRVFLLINHLSRVIIKALILTLIPLLKFFSENQKVKSMCNKSSLFNTVEILEFKKMTAAAEKTTKTF